MRGMFCCAFGGRIGEDLFFGEQKERTFSGGDYVFNAMKIKGRIFFL
jgi:hypothetical protein